MLDVLLRLIQNKAPIGKGDLPDVKRNAAGGYRMQQPLTRRNLEAVLEWMECRVRYNVMTQKPVFLFRGAGFSPEEDSGAEQALVDVLAKLDVSGSRSAVIEVLGVVAMSDRFHPMQDWLVSLPDPGTRDYIGELAATIETECVLWPTYLENWLVQVVDGVCGWDSARAGVDARGESRRGLPYCLVLVGGQGIGKTHWFRTLGQGWLCPEVELQLGSGAMGRDHQLAALRWPMAELAELDGIFRKADLSHLKAFLSRATDYIRAPYARREVESPRMTTFCGSVNVGEFLVDSTGSRRFWPVEVSRVRGTAGVDFNGVWAQAYALWQESPVFTLTRKEDEMRVRDGAKHQQLSSEVEMLAGYWAAHKNHTEMFKPMNRTEILHMLGFRNLSPKTISEAGQFLADNIGKMRTISDKQRSWDFPYSDLAHDPSTWRKEFLHLIR